MNTGLMFIGMVFVFSSLVIMKKWLGAVGVIGFMGFATITANILICKSVDLIGMGATLGNVMFASNFLATDILTECYGIEEARKGIKIAMTSAVGFLAVTQMAMLFIPNETDIAQTAYETLFTLTPRITMASVTLFALSNIADINLYAFISKKTNGKYMWLRNNVSTILCNGAENFFFYTIAFFGVFAWSDIVSMSITATIIEVVIALCDTPFLYVAKGVNLGVNE